MNCFLCATNKEMRERSGKVELFNMSQQHYSSDDNCLNNEPVKLATECDYVVCVSSSCDGWSEKSSNISICLFVAPDIEVDIK